MRKRFILSFVVIVCCLAGSAAMAESIGTCVDTGYAAMSGSMGVNGTNKDYVMVGGGNQTGSEGYWGFAWLKFGDLPAEAVDEAWLSLESFGVGSGMFTYASDEQPINIAVQAVTADVAGITSSNVGSFKDNNIVAGSVAAVSVGDPGVYSWDITSLVNEWISTGVNNGLVLTGWENSDNWSLNTKFGGLPNGGASTSLAPTLASTPVPEPSTIAMLVGLGLLGMVGVFRKH